MRRGVGVSAVKKKAAEKKQFSAVGREMEEAKLATVREMLTNFQTALTEFASKHRAKINSDPEFRMQFHLMCRSAGVDPLASNRGTDSDSMSCANAIL
jgi:ESCRT-II complex subunit VPS22